MIVVCDSSPLISLAKIDSFLLFQKLYGGLIISGEVYAEVVVAGAGLTGAADTSKAAWIEVRQIKNPADLTLAQFRFGLEVGELSTMILAREVGAGLVIFDDLGARKIAQKEGFKVQGCVAILEACFRKGFLADLRNAYKQMLQKGVYLNQQLLTPVLKVSIFHRSKHSMSVPLLIHPPLCTLLRILPLSIVSASKWQSCRANVSLHSALQLWRPSQLEHVRTHRKAKEAYAGPGVTIPKRCFSASMPG